MWMSVGFKLGSSYLITKCSQMSILIIRFCLATITKTFFQGWWWWSSGQCARFTSDSLSLNPAVAYCFSVNCCLKRTKNNKKRLVLDHFKYCCYGHFKNLKSRCSKIFWVMMSTFLILITYLDLHDHWEDDSLEIIQSAIKRVYFNLLFRFGLACLFTNGMDFEQTEESRS